jgi:hypothetical protein
MSPWQPELDVYCRAETIKGMLALGIKDLWASLEP